MSADLTPPHLLTPRDWQARAQLEASDLLGSPEGAAKLAEARRYGALADHIASLQARLDAAEKSKATLLDALAGAVTRCQRFGYVGSDGQYIKVMRAAIDAATQEQQP